MQLRGIRGATSADENSRDEIVNKTIELLEKMIKQNNIKVEDVASAFFSVTPDLNAEFPAAAARKLGWIYTPLLCLNEIDVPGSLKSCIRVLLHVNSSLPQEDIVHIYLHEAKKLRPDLDVGKKSSGKSYYISE